MDDERLLHGMGDERLLVAGHCPNPFQHEWPVRAAYLTLLPVTQRVQCRRAAQSAAMASPASAFLLLCAPCGLPDCIPTVASA